MTFGEKLKSVRLSLDISQSELSEKTGISERSLYTYEQCGIMPRSNNLKKIAEVLNVSVNYLLNEEETDPNKDIDNELFIANSKNKFGYKGAKEATEILSRASALFAGGELDDSAKELFFKSIMEVYLDSKSEARKKYSPKQRAGKSKSKSK